jgi:hypothetical protein
MEFPSIHLAAALGELPDLELALELGADPEKVWRLRLSMYPRSASWTADISRLAEAIGGDPILLDVLLRRLVTARDRRRQLRPGP